MAHKIVAGNWKMHKTAEEAKILTSEIIEMVNDEVRSDTRVILCVPFPYLLPVSALVNNSDVSVGAQNCHYEEQGAFTGEVSAAMLKSSRAEYVILGHSERREYFQESDALILKKCKKAFQNGLSVIYCCGEKLESREKGKHFDVVSAQLENSVLKLAETELAKLIIAYEPVWAIGTGKTATAAQAQEMHSFIRKQLSLKFGVGPAYNVPILYGGSVKPENAKEIFEQKDVDGGLIGGASLKSRDFVDIVKSFN